MNDSVLEQVCQIAAETFGASLDQVAPESSPQTLPNWDSIQHLNFVLALEARFGVELSPEQIEQIHSIADAAGAVDTSRRVS